MTLVWVRHRTLRPFHAISGYNRLVSGSLHPPSGVLFSFQSPYYCAIGLGTYLGLEVSASHIHARYPTHATRDPPNSLSDLPLRGYHPLRHHFPEDFTSVSEAMPRSPTPHLLHVSMQDSVCPVPLSIAFTHGISIDFFSCGY